MTTIDWRAQLGMRNGVTLGPGQEAFNTVADYIARKHDMSRAQAGRLLDQAITFVHFAAQSPADAYAPSPDVDVAWDAFIAHTLIYTRWCEETFGRYMHHTPVADPDNPPPTIGGRPLIRPAATATAMADAGYRVDWELWPEDAEATSKANCTMCYSGDHVGDDGP